jgi:hypothetical protein
MKKFLVLSVATVTLLALSGQRASAWKQIKFGVGLNLEGSSGGNNLLWGLAKGQQPPAQGFGGGYPGAFPAPMAAPYGVGLGGPGYQIGQETEPLTPPQPASNKVQPVGYLPYDYAPAEYYLPEEYANYLPPFYWPGR